jgi:hypothetical protein
MQHAFVAADSAGLFVLNVSDPVNLEEVGALATDEPARAVAVGDNGYVYLGSGNTAQVVDRSRPEAPVEVGSFVSPGGSPRKLARVGDML